MKMNLWKMSRKQILKEYLESSAVMMTELKQVKPVRTAPVEEKSNNLHFC